MIRKSQPDEARRAFLAAGVAGLAAAVGPMAHGAPGTFPDPDEPAAGPRPVELPGLVDLQVNGFAGVDFGDPATTVEQVRSAVRAIARTGVTRFLPTLITSSLDDFAACAKTVLAAKDPAIAGLHMEGPYISAEDGARGAHAREWVRGADLDDFRRRQDAADGRIVLVTLAPESPGALRLVEHLAASGVRVAIGHTAATPAQVADTVNAGATLSTHLGNGCAQMLPRHPNFIWEQLAEDRLTASFIVDGHHLPPATVKAMIRAKTPARTILVTDAIAAAGMPPGIYQLAKQRVELSADGRVALPGSPYLAGSALVLSVAIGNAVRFTGLPFEEVVAMASSRPAAYLGIPTAGTVTGTWDPAIGELRVERVDVPTSSGASPR